MSSRIARLIGFCSLLLGALLLNGRIASDTRGTASPAFAGGTGLPGYVVIAFDQGVSSPDRAALLARHQAITDAVIAPLDVMRLRVPPGREQAAVEALSKEPGVRYAQLDHPARALETPNDPRWSAQWNMRQIRADDAWDLVRDVEGRIIAIVDSGIDLDHPDLANVVWTNLGEVPGNDLDDDHNGKVDDVYGWHFGVECNYTQGCWQVEDNNVEDDYGHGTHVAGIAGAEANNDVGVAGVAWGARLMAVKVLDEYGYGSCFDVAAGVTYAAQNGASVINICIACSSVSGPLADAIAYARQGRGSLVVAAAGNDGGEVVYPASDPLALAVGAVDSSGARASFSNRGPALDVMAPGVDVLSTWPLRDGYFEKSGTSMAGPHVSGLAALAWAADPSLSAAQVTEVITSTAIDLGPAGRDDRHGYGLIDARAAVQAVLGDVTPTPVASPSRTPRPTRTGAPTATSTPTGTATGTATATASSTPAPSATVTPTASPTPTATATVTSTTTWTPEPPATSTASPSPTEDVTLTATPTFTRTPSPTVVLTATPHPTRSTPAAARVYLPLLRPYRP